MQLNIQFDQDALKISEKLIFSCEEYELSQKDIAQLKKEKLIKYIQEEDFPETISCQVLMSLETTKKAKIIFFNPKFILPDAVLENHFFNKDIIEQCSVNGGFWLEFLLPLDKKGIKLNFSYEIV